MHNLHYVVVKAETAEDAVSEVETMISDWGTENNWRSFGGCVSEDNEVYIVPPTGTWGNSRWAPEENHTIEMINQQVREWLKPDKHYQDIFDKCVSGDIGSPFDWYGAMKYCEHKFHSAQHEIKGREFDVLHDEFYDWHFDECGVTHFMTKQFDRRNLDYEDPKHKRYVVFVDMHS